MVIEGDRVILRLIGSSDMLSLQRWDDDPEIVRLVGKKFLYPERTPAWLARMRHSPECLALAIVDRASNTLMGDLELEDISWRSGRAELRICIGEKRFWGKGYGTEAIRTFIDHAFSNTSLKHVYLRVYASNHRAIACYRKCGFRAEGILRVGHKRQELSEDLLLMTLDKEMCRYQAC
ncbi:MAG: GNAT family N-acetyltransferase [Bacillota bacterium]|nr:GNAT family N-acetyltransferase [Bacillota bacterium]